MTEDQRQDREDAFREFHADQLRQQTKHLSSIQTMLSVWMTLMIIGVALWVIAAIASANSGY